MYTPGMERKVSKLQNASLDSFCAVRMENGDYCFSSDEYKAIMSKRKNSVDSRAIIAEGL